MSGRTGNAILDKAHELDFLLCNHAPLEQINQFFCENQKNLIGIFQKMKHVNMFFSTDFIAAIDDCYVKDICLHIASSAPEFVSRKDIPQSVIDEETRIEMGKEDLAKKPENIREKIVEGRINKLMAGRCLLEQPFVKNIM